MSGGGRGRRGIERADYRIVGFRVGVEVEIYPLAFLRDPFSPLFTIGDGMLVKLRSCFGRLT